MTIAVDFDGTIVEHRYPQIGEEIPFATATLKMLINERHRLILWSVREGNGPPAQRRKVDNHGASSWQCVRGSSEVQALPRPV